MTTDTIHAIDSETARLTDELARETADQAADALRILSRLSSDAAAAALRKIEAAQEARLAVRVAAIEALERAVRALRAARAALVALASAPPLPRLSAGALREIRARVHGLDLALECFHAAEKGVVSADTPGGAEPRP